MTPWDHFGLDPRVMLGQVLELSRSTAAKVDVIEKRQRHLVIRLDRVERQAPERPQRRLSAVLGTLAAWTAAALTAVGGVLANLKAEQIAAAVKAFLEASPHP